MGEFNIGGGEFVTRTTLNPTAGSGGRAGGGGLGRQRQWLRLEKPEVASCAVVAAIWPRALDGLPERAAGQAAGPSGAN